MERDGQGGVQLTTGGERRIRKNAFFQAGSNPLEASKRVATQALARM